MEREAAPAPPEERLFGRRSGHRLRPRQRWLLDEILPRLRYAPPAPLPAAETWLEIGFGGGEHLLAQAAAHPAVGLIGCEVFLPGLCSLLSALLPQGAPPDALPARLRIWDGDARRLLRLLPDGALRRVFLLFPDPWPKSRHAARRFVQPATVAEVARVLAPGGEWRLASDDPVYQAWVCAVLAAQTLFSGATPLAERPADWPITRYEAKAHAAGRQPQYWRLLRREPC